MREGVDVEIHGGMREGVDVEIHGGMREGVDVEIHGGMREGVDVEIHVFLTSALLACEWSASRSGGFNPEERVPLVHCIRG
jgi:hypothetical protein